MSVFFKTETLTSDTKLKTKLP